MTTTKLLDRQDFRALFKLSQKVEPFPEHNFYDEFCDNLSIRRGFTIWNKDKLVGMVSYSDFIPGVVVVIHFLQDPDYKGSVTRKTVKEAFSFPFEKLHVPRLSSYCITGVTDSAGKYLKRLGFRLEGTFKESTRTPNGFKDVEIYGMLKSECKWL